MEGEGYPVSLLLDGPLFRDELETQPQQLKRDIELDTLRLVPSKSAASGVYAIYFTPSHRQWALVRLATRYRGLFEIQLQRGMSGEHQLLRQGFTPDDLAFLSDIVPRPPGQYSPIVYDMLWLVATYDEYLSLARALLDRNEFVPEELLRSTPGVSVDDVGFFTRFLRSHLIQSTSAASNRSDGNKSDISMTLENTYEVSDDGRDALRGIVAEYERIFERKAFDPLLINPDLDPLKHLRDYESSRDDSSTDVPLEELEGSEEILGEIAESFAPLEDELDSPDGTTGAAEEDTQEVHTDDTRDSGETNEREPARGSHPVSGPIPATDRAERNANSMQSDSSVADADVDREPSHSESAERPVPMINEFTEDEVVRATVAAATAINEATLVRTSDIKTTTWEEVDLSGRSRESLWEAVQDVLLAMDAVHGRDGGHIWVSDEFKG